MPIIGPKSCVARDETRLESWHPTYVKQAGLAQKHHEYGGRAVRLRLLADSRASQPEFYVHNQDRSSH
jgi:hypothetical protein